MAWINAKEYSIIFNVTEKTAYNHINNADNLESIKIRNTKHANIDLLKILKEQGKFSVNLVESEGSELMSQDMEKIQRFIVASFNALSEKSKEMNDKVLSQIDDSIKDKIVEQTKNNYERMLDEKNRLIEDMKKEKTSLMNDLQRELSKPLFKKLFG